MEDFTSKQLTKDFSMKKANLIRLLVVFIFGLSLGLLASPVAHSECFFNCGGGGGGGGGGSWVGIFGPPLTFGLGDDWDDDGIKDHLDNCPTIPNFNQSDSDRDGIGDVCDNCPDIPNPEQVDIDGDKLGNACDDDDDGDGVPDSLDNCPLIANPSQLDFDKDKIGDACDPGGGNPNADTDKDTVPDSVDNCPDIKNPGQEDADNDKIGDVCDNDIDGDGIANGNDNCEFVPNPGQEDKDADGLGNVCDTTELYVFDDSPIHAIKETEPNDPTFPTGRDANALSLDLANAGDELQITMGYGISKKGEWRKPRIVHFPTPAMKTSATQTWQVSVQITKRDPKSMKIDTEHLQFDIDRDPTMVVLNATNDDTFKFKADQMGEFEANVRFTKRDPVTHKLTKTSVTKPIMFLVYDEKGFFKTAASASSSVSAGGSGCGAVHPGTNRGMASMFVLLFAGLMVFVGRHFSSKKG
jgi:hypothetical protein